MMGGEMGSQSGPSRVPPSTFSASSTAQARGGEIGRRLFALDALQDLLTTRAMATLLDTRRARLPDRHLTLILKHSA